MKAKLVGVVVLAALLTAGVAAAASMGGSIGLTRDITYTKIMINNIENIVLKIEEKISILESLGVDTSSFKGEFSQIKSSLELARSKIESAEDKVKSGEIDEARDLIDEARDIADDCNDSANQLLSLLIDKIKEASQSEKSGEESKVCEKCEEHMKTHMKEHKAEEHKEYGKEIGKVMRKVTKAEIEKVREKVRKIREKALKYRKAYGMALEDYEKFKGRYMKLKEEFRKSDKRLENRETMRIAKNYIAMGLMMTERWLHMVREQAMLMGPEGSEIAEKASELIQKIEMLKEKVNTSATPQELREAAKEIREEWKELRRDMHALALSVAVAKVEAVVEKAEQVGLRIETKIDALRDAEIDTSKLEELLEEYLAKIDLAREKIEEVKSLLEEGKPLEARKALIEVNKLLREAFGIVKEIYKELLQEKYRFKYGKIFYGNQTGEVFVSGNGTLEFTGTAVVVIRGSVEVSVEPKDSVVTLVGFSVKSVAGDVARYGGEGKMVIRGENITLKLEGEDFKLIAKGFGRIDLNGTGVYRVKISPSEPMSELMEYEGSETIVFGGEQ